MLCTSCDTETQAGSTYCSNCGEALPTDQPEKSSSENNNSGKRGLFSGCLILLRSIFTMPIKTAKLAAHELRKIAEAGEIDTDRDFPHLFWSKAMLPVVATFISLAVLLGTFGFAIATGGAGGLIAGLVGAPLAAVAADWLIMIVGEYLMIKVVSARYYTQKIEQHERENSRE